MPELSGTKWGSHEPGTTGGVVTWSIAPSGQDIYWFTDEEPGTSFSVDPATVYTFDFEASLRMAFAAWSQYGNVEFVQVADPGGAAGDQIDPDIRIFFAPIPGNTLGFGFFPSPLEVPIAGDILLDVDRSLNFDVPLFEGLAIHEIGHALGLEHIETVDAIMNSILTQPDILADDIAGIREIYGRQDGAVAVYTMPTGLENLTLLHNPEELTVLGNSLGNRIDGTSADEIFNGLTGNDTLDGREGDDLLIGGAGIDWAVLGAVTRAGAAFSVVAEGLQVVSLLGTDTLIDVEWIQFLDEVVSVAEVIADISGPVGVELIGGGLPDRLTGTDDNDTLIGDAGDDVLAGGLGDDLLNGGDGDDRMSASDGNDIVLGGLGHDNIGGGLGNDTIDGGDGDDTIGGGFGSDSITGGAGNDVVAGGADNDTLSGGDGNDSMSGSFGNDRIDAGDGADDIGGGTGRDTIDAGAGNDRVGGGEGDDSIFGAAGNDFLAGGGRNDVIDGGIGNDTINGGSGSDLITGGAGADQFVFSTFVDGDADVITDFEDGLDRFLIRRIDPDTGEVNITNGNNGLAGFVAAMNITDTAAGAQMSVGGNTILVEGIAAALLTVDDFTFI
ncbi:matrixin family metalloprotease [Roseovarius sp.]|uniref:matrixin family metalloprotease n=1 Tax=Roseovarius sp. TaxID=1486281 RepID=UPI001B4FCC72|nr:matrixin family metalloprotease [Roseovarius sp.]MBQ0809286.1 matrixin family metalloprotease [Roseovarius sp.]